MVKRNAITPAKKKKFLEAIAKGFSVSMSCRMAHFSKSGIQKHVKKSAAFKKAWDEAYETGADVLEDEAWRRAVEGWDEPKWYQDKEVGAVRKFSDRLLEMLLKARRPDKYRERIDANVTGDITVKVVKFANGDKDTK